MALVVGDLIDGVVAAINGKGVWAAGMNNFQSWESGRLFPASRLWCVLGVSYVIRSAWGNLC